MKKAKFVLTSIAALGILGGVFAFKAKSAYTGGKIFTAPTSTVVATALYSIHATTAPAGTTSYYWTTTNTAKAVNFSNLEANL